jgi:transcriptional regulator with XRE-family HTH domain
MAVQEWLVSELRQKFAGESDSAIARRAGLKQARFSNYVQGTRSMDDDAVIGCAEALGVDPVPLVKQHRAELARTRREAAFWRNVATVALCAIALPYLIDSQGIEFASLYIMLAALVIAATVGTELVRQPFPFFGANDAEGSDADRGHRPGAVLA